MSKQMEILTDKGIQLLHDLNERLGQDFDV